MKQRHTAGFTIIEVVLFLAISGVLAVGLLVGIGSAIQQQQYRDAVQSYVGFLRGQYAQVLAVQNDRPDDQVCPIEGVSGSTIKGRSDCFVVGRYIATTGPVDNNDGRKYQAWPVYGAKIGDTWRYGYRAGDATEYEVGWGAKTRFSHQGASSANIAILMYRDPDNGSVVVKSDSATYPENRIGDLFRGTTDSSDANINQFGDREICIYDTGWLVAQRQSVQLSSYAGSADAITLINASEACKNG